MDNNTSLGFPGNAQRSPGEVPKANVGVRRVNNRPMMIIGVALLGFVLILVVALSGRGNKKVDAEVQAAGKGGSTILLAEKMAGEMDAGFIPAPAPEPSPPVAPMIDLDQPPVLVEHPDAAPEETELEKRLKAVKLAQLEQAIKAKTVMASRAPRSQGSPMADGRSPQSQAMMQRRQELQQQMAQLNQMSANIPMVGGGGSGSGGGGYAGPKGEQRPNNDIAQFAGNDKGDRWLLGKTMQAPRTPYELRAGFVIPATLISGINSQLPGQIMGQVTQDVYDTATGKYKLIPQGSRLIGQYTSDVAYGQSRVMAAWQRIIFPDGKALDIGSMYAADGAGYSGMSDKVNNHYLRIFGSAILMSGVTAGVTKALDKNKADNGNVPSIQDSLNAALAQQLGQVSMEMIRKNMNIAPTLEIRPGFRLNVMVVKDLTFTKPYQAFDY